MIKRARNVCIYMVYPTPNLTKFSTHKLQEILEVQLLRSVQRQTLNIIKIQYNN